MNKTEKFIFEDFKKQQPHIEKLLKSEDWKNRPEGDQDLNKFDYPHPFVWRGGTAYAVYDIKKGIIKKLQYVLIKNIKI